MSEALDFAPAPLREYEAGPEWDPTEQEPNLDIIVRSRRAVDTRGIPYSRWEFGWALEGVWKAPMSQPQLDYFGTMLRHIATINQDRPVLGQTFDENLKAIADRFHQQVRASIDGYASMAFYMVERYGLDKTASILRKKKREVEHLLKSRKKMPTTSHPPELKEAPMEKDLLKEIANAVVREKVAVG